jgi:hypothetical protein
MSSRLASPSCPYAAGSARNLDHRSQRHQKKGTSPPRQELREIRWVQPSRRKRACSRLASSGRFLLGAGIEPLCSKTTLCPSSAAPPARSCSPSPSPLPLLWPKQGREAPLAWTSDVLASRLPIAHWRVGGLTWRGASGRRGQRRGPAAARPQCCPRWPPPSPPPRGCGPPGCAASTWAQPPQQGRAVRSFSVNEDRPGRTGSDNTSDSERSSQYQGSCKRQRPCSKPKEGDRRTMLACLLKAAFLQSQAGRIRGLLSLFRVAHVERIRFVAAADTKSNIGFNEGGHGSWTAPQKQEEAEPCQCKDPLEILLTHSGKNIR